MMEQYCISRFFRWFRPAPALLWLLLCVVAALCCLRAELEAARERAGQRLSSVAREYAVRLDGHRQRALDDGVALAADSLLAAAVTSFLADGRSANLLRERLQSLKDLGRYLDVLLLDPSGTVRLSLAGAQAASGVWFDPLHGQATEVRPSFLVVKDEKVGQSRPLLGVAAPLMQVDRYRDRLLATVVLLVDPLVLDTTADPAAEISLLLVLHQDREQPVVLAGTRRLQPSTPVLAERLVETALAGTTGVVRGLDHQGNALLGTIIPVPGMDWSVLAAQSMSANGDPWSFRGTGLLTALALGGSLILWRRPGNRRQRARKQAACRDLPTRLQQQLTTLVQHSRDGVLILDQRGLVQEINPEACRLTGWVRADAIGRRLEEVFPLVEDPGRVVSSPSPEAINAETAARLLTREGRTLSIALVVAPWAGNDGAATARILMFHDRSGESLSRQRVESRLLLREYAYTHGVHELLHRAVQELATLVASPRGFCCSLEPPLCAVAVERSAQPGNEQPWSWYDAEGEPICSSLRQWLPELPAELLVVDPGLRVGENEELEEDSDSGPSCRFGTVREMLLPLQRAGRLVAVIVLADKPRPYSSADVDTLTQMGEYIWRLVEQKQMEEALLASERRYRTLYRSMMDAFVVTDLGGRIRECNQAYAAMLGFSPEALKGRAARDFTPEKWREYEQEHVRKQLMHGGCSDLYEKEYRHRDGRVFPVELRTFLLVNNEGQPEGMSAVVRDISRRRQAQEEREKLRDRLNLAQKLESVGQLAGGVAHDFNNMLSVIIGFAELGLRRMEVPDPLDKYLQEIVTAAKRSADVTRQLLAFARQQTIAPKVLDLNVTLAGMLKMLRRLIGENIELSWLPGEGIWPVNMDPTQIDQLLANLCVNARDAIGGVGKITIETGRVSFDKAYCTERSGFIPGDFAVLAVSDNGSGIERALLEKIFEPFFTTKEVGQGTGLGLATVYGIVKQNQGFIHVYSEPGQGSTFRLYLPRHRGRTEQISSVDAQTIPTGQGELILVVEDEPAMLSLIQTLLEQLNYKVLTASKPGKALQLARAYGQAIDLVIIDVIMPEMNGRDLAKAMMEGCPSVKILFMSGYTAGVIAHRGELEPGTRFLTKPFSTGELACRIEETLHG